MKRVDLSTSTTEKAAGIRMGAPNIAVLMSEARKLMTRANGMAILHWIVIITGTLGAFGTTFLVPANEKLAGYGAVVMILSVSSILNKFASALNHQVTLAQSVAVTIPLVEAAVTGNATQQDEVHTEMHK